MSLLEPFQLLLIFLPTQIPFLFTWHYSSSFCHCGTGEQMSMFLWQYGDFSSEILYLREETVRLVWVDEIFQDHEDPTMEQ